MRTTIQNIKTDLYHVFVAGDAKSQELARVFLLLDIPLMLVIFAIFQFVKF
ncbi:MAG: hypothetical protein ACXVB0_14465 [Mucilaginibacter sp.]